MVKKSLLVLGMISVLALAFPLLVAAQGGQPPATAPRQGQTAASAMAWRGAQRGGWLTGGVSLVEATAQATGLTVAEVIAALEGGQTYADIAAEAGVTPQAIVDVVLEVRAAALAQAVAEGRFTQEQMDTMLATMAADLLAQLNAPWEPQGAGNGAALDGSQLQSGTAYHGGNLQGRGQRGNAEVCPALQP